MGVVVAVVTGDLTATVARNNDRTSQTQRVEEEEAETRSARDSRWMVGGRVSEQCRSRRTGGSCWLGHVGSTSVVERYCPRPRELYAQTGISIAAGRRGPDGESTWAAAGRRGFEEEKQAAETAREERRKGAAYEPAVEGGSRARES